MKQNNIILSFQCSGIKDCVYLSKKDKSCKYLSKIEGFNFCNSAVARVNRMILEIKRYGVSIDNP